MNPRFHALYEQLRSILMQMHQAGVPGIDQVIMALNKAHIGLSAQQPGQQPPAPFTQTNQPAQGASPMPMQPPQGQVPSALMQQGGGQ